MKAIVVAMGKNNEIGANQDMPWGRALPDDLNHFKRLTTGKSIIYGRKTFESFGSKPLSNRENIVVTSKPTGVKGVLSAASLESAYALARYPVFVIGGGSIYDQVINDMDVLYVTEIDTEFPDATVFFPLVDTNTWKETDRVHYDADKRNLYSFDIVTYVKA